MYLNTDKTYMSRRTFLFLFLVKVSYDYRILWHKNTTSQDMNKNSLILDTLLNVWMHAITDILCFFIPIDRIELDGI